MPAIVAVRVRRTGLCPTLERPSLQRDGMLVRVPLVGGSLTIDQLELIADLAERFGNGVVELTNRGNLQLRGVADESVAMVVGALGAAGLGDVMARIVTISPLAGPAEHAIRAAVVDVLDAVDLVGLSAKFVVHVDDGSRSSGRHADIVLAYAPGGAVTVDAGTGRSTMPLAAAMVLVEGIVARCIAHGTQARWKDVAGLDAPAPAPAPGIAFEPPVGRVPLAPGASFVAGVPLGRTTPEQLRDLARVCRAQGVGEVRVTPWRSLMLVTAEADTVRLAARLDDIGLITSAADPAHGVVTCIGRAGCWQTELDTLAEAADAIVRRSSGEDRRIGDGGAFGAGAAGRENRHGTLHVSGCAKSCATIEPVTVLLVGRDDSSGFDVVRSAEACS